MFAYNEAPTLGGAVNEAAEALESLGRDYEIIIVDDGSTDGSGEIADRLAAGNSRISVIHHPTNLGMGGVYRSGLKAARKPIVSFLASDGQPIPRLYYERCLPALNGRDLVIGYLPNRRDPPLTLFFAWAERLWMRILFPGVPKIDGPFMFRRRLLDAIDLELLESTDRSWAVLIELEVKAIRSGCSFARVPVERRPRRSGRSRGSSWRNAVVMAVALLRLRWRLRR